MTYDSRTVNYEEECPECGTKGYTLKCNSKHFFCNTVVARNGETITVGFTCLLVTVRDLQKRIAKLEEK